MQQLQDKVTSSCLLSLLEVSCYQTWASVGVNICFKSNEWPQSYSECSEHSTVEGCSISSSGGNCDWEPGQSHWLLSTWMLLLPKDICCCSEHHSIIVHRSPNSYGGWSILFFSWWWWFYSLSSCICVPVLMGECTWICYILEIQICEHVPSVWKICLNH